MGLRAAAHVLDASVLRGAPVHRRAEGLGAAERLKYAWWPVGVPRTGVKYQHEDSPGAIAN